jgi:polar amino acid transport system substrate-binding protein
MKKLLGILAALIIAVSVFLWFRQTSDAQPLGDTLLVGTSADFPPFSFIGSDDSIDGFDIDIIKEVAKRLNMKIKIQDRPFDMLIPQIELGQIHVIAAGMTPTPERAKRVRFSKVYLTSNPLLMVTRAGDPVINDLEDLKGKEVIVNTGYTADLFMSDKPDVKLLRLPKVADALIALEQGKADAFITASFTLKPYLTEDDKRFNIVQMKETDEQDALAFSMLLPQDFVDKAQKALDDMEAEGTMTALKEKWKVL